MVTVYKSNDPGVPSYSFSSSSASALHFAAFKIILKACLVTGYGTKPAAGWDLLDEGDTYLVLAPATGSGVLIIQMTFSTSIATVSVASNYSGLVAGVPTGEGLKTGVAANNAAPQRLGLAFFAYSASAHSWSLIADEKTFVFNAGGYAANSNFDSGSTLSDQACLALYAGEDSEGNFMAVGGNNSATATSSSSYAQATFGHGGVSVLKFPSTGLLVGSAAANVWMPLGRARIQSAPTYILPSPLPAFGVAQLNKVPWFESVSRGGYLRGVCVPFGCSDLYPAQLAQAFGRSAVEGAKPNNANLPLDLGDVHSYFPTLQSYYSTARIITDNPEFW